MDYYSLNENNKKKIHNICKTDYQMDWEDPNYLYKLAGDLPAIRHTNYDESISTELQNLRILYESYEPTYSEKESFIRNLNEILSRIRKIHEYWYGLDLLSVSNCIDMQKFCVITGEGGIGKTYFVMQLEEELTRREIPHLCIYGKFEKNLKRIDFGEIDKLSKNCRFVLIIDALNEMNPDAYMELCKKIPKLICNRGLQLLITYRSYTLCSSVEQEINSLAKHKSTFPGVSYESALDLLIKSGVPDVYKYENILFSNNAYLLSKLRTVLSHSTITEEKNNSICSITYIIENGGIKERLDKAAWNNTKKITQWILNNESFSVPIYCIYKLIDNARYYISKMQEEGYITVHNHKETTFAVFSSESLIEFLVARDMLNQIEYLSHEERVNYIKGKIDALPRIKEATIIILFDKYKDNYLELKEILEATSLINNLTPEVLVKIQINDISEFMEVFYSDIEKDDIDCILYFAGYYNKPFNCINYLNELLFGNKSVQNKLTTLLSGGFFKGDVKGRLKNLLYFIAFNGVADVRVEEAFYFALWCTAAPNRDIRYLSMKLLYDISSRNNRYINKLIKILPFVYDQYIIESIVYVLAFCDDGSNKSIRDCLLKLAKDPDFHLARSLKRIASYLGNSHMYIRWDKNNIYTQSFLESPSSEFLNRMGVVDLVDKYLLPFSYWGQNDFRNIDTFIIDDKDKISRLNDEVNNKYTCLKHNYRCRSSKQLKNYLCNQFQVNNEALLDTNKYVAAFEDVLRNLYKEFDLDFDKDLHSKTGDKFLNSPFRKLIDISKDCFMGSIMCNYYKSNFNYYEGEESWGFEVYDPLPYIDSEDINLIAPITTFNSSIEEIGSFLVDRIELPDNKDSGWHGDTIITERNLINLLKPITYKNEDWVLLSARVNLFEKDGLDTLWKDTYSVFCCTSNRRIKGFADRYLTIEIPEYNNNISFYAKCCDNSDVCKSVRPIANSNEFDESNLTLPPAELIRYYSLKPSYKDLSWVDSKGNVVILCDNNKNSYYNDFVSGLVVIRRDKYENYLKHGIIKHFAFSEKLIQGKGYNTDSWYHYELQNGGIVQKFSNNQSDYVDESQNDVIQNCENCPFGLYNK